MDAITPGKLVLLDTMALIYRAHFALIRSPRFTSKQQCTSAVFGLANTLLDLIGREKPTHLAAVFDTADPTARHVEYPEYKAHRDEMPEDLSSQLPLVDRLMQAFQIPIIRLPGYEADDIIGTLAHQASSLGFETLMVTPDKDYDQLVAPHVRIWKPGRQGNSHEQFGVEEVLAKWEIERVDQVIDILSLMGDSSDNIPGVPGIGPKTAVKLIQQFGSLENLLAGVSQLKGKQRENLEKYADLARLSKKLVTIQLDVPHAFSIQELDWTGYDPVQLAALFVELEFQTLGKRLFGDGFSLQPSAIQSTNFIAAGEWAPPVTAGDNLQAGDLSTSAVVIGPGTSAPSQSLSQFDSRAQPLLFDEHTGEPGKVPGKLREPSGDRVNETSVVSEIATLMERARYRIVQTHEGRCELVQRLSGVSQVCFDTETTGLDPRLARLLGIAFAVQPQEAYYVVCPEEPSEMQAVLDQFRAVFENPAITKIGHNLKYDLTLLRWHGVQVNGPIVDTMLAHIILESEMDHGLDQLAKVYLGYQTITIEQLIGPKGPKQLNMADISVDQVGPYACEDADIALRISQELLPAIEERSLQRVCYDIEFPLINVLVDMEFSGIRLDSEALLRFSKKLETEIADLENKIYQTAGRKFNIDSPKQLGDLLYRELKIEDNPKKTATGQYTTRESELERLSGRHPIIADILDYRNATKLKRTYVDQLPGYLDPRTRRLHTVYSQAWTATGRMQSVNPNLQTIPIRKERGREIRAAFVPRDENYLILSADYSQIELRVMAELSGDPAMLEAFQQNIDIHAVTASKVYGVPVGLVTREMRSQAKMVNFGIIYGISSFGLQQRLNIPRAEAQSLIENYFAEYPQVKQYIQTTIDFARKNGYVQTLTGRRRYLRDINSRSRTAATAAERLAMNSPIQGTAADILKLAMISVHRALKQGGFQTKMLLTVHDEIVFDMHKSEVDQVIPVIRNCMSSAFPMKVPLVVDAGYGENWLDAH